MRYFISDVHGEYCLFVRLLERIGFSDGDEMFICGDIIDKGDESVRLAKLVSSMPNVHCILGNHEYEFLKLYHASTMNGDDFEEILSRLKEFFPNDGHLLDWDLVDWIDALPPYIEGEDFICIHAGVPTDEKGYLLPMQSVPLEQLLYDRRFKEPSFVHKSPKCVFFGHTQTNCICSENKILGYKRDKGAEVKDLSDYYKIHLDTGCWSNGVLGCFCADTCKAVYIKK